MESVRCIKQWDSTNWALEKYNLYKTMLFRIAFSYLGNKHDSDDVLQEVFIKLYYSAPDFPSAEDEKRWVIRVTINQCKDYLRSYWYRNKISMEDLDQYTSVQEDREDLKEILNLPPKYKIVIHLYYLEGYNIAEIAKILKLSVSAIKMRLKRGRELLKIELEGYYES